MNARVREVLEGAIQSESIKELFETENTYLLIFLARNIWTR